MMHHLLSPVLDRRLLFIERLTSLASPQPLSELARALHTNSRTLANDILVINQSWQAVEITVTGDVVSLAYRPGFNLGDIYRLLLTREPIFRLLRALILHPGVETSELAKEATMSEASLYRHVNFFNASLFPQLGISIASNPFRLEGERPDLLLFSSIFLFKQNRMDDWPFADYPQKEVEDLVSLLFDATRVSVPFSEFRMLTFYVVLSMIWAKAFGEKEPLSATSPLEEILAEGHARDVIASLPHLQETLDAVKPYEPIFSFPMTLPSLIYLFSFFFRNGFFLHYHSFLEQAVVDPKINKSFFYLTKILDELERNYGIKPENRHKILRELHNTLYCRYMDPDTAPFFTMMEDNFQAWLGRSVTGLPLDLKEKIRGYFLHMDLPVIEPLVTSCVFYVFVKWGRLFYQQLSPVEPVSLLIVSSVGTEHAQTLRDLVRMEIDIPLRVDIFSDLRIDGAELLHSGYDVVWSNFSIPDRETDRNGNPWSKEASELILYNLYPSQKESLSLQHAIAAKAKKHEEGYFV